MIIAEKVWQLYKTAKEGQATTIRSGYGLCGVYPYDKNRPRDFNRSESDAEHVFGCIILATNIMELYPYIIPMDDRYKVLQCLAIHELGENEGGDIPDDGTRDEQKKDAEELEYVKKYLSNWHEVHANQVLSAFIEMQQKSTELGRFIYCIDKTEALLQNLIYESEGRPATFSAKLESTGFLSDRDREEMKIADSDKTSDGWAWGFRNRYGNIEYFDIFFNIVRAAVCDVRGKDFDWLDAKT